MAFLLRLAIVLCACLARPCDCAGTITVNEAKKLAAVVFRGTITEFRNSDSGERFVVFRVTRVLRSEVAMFNIKCLTLIYLLATASGVADAASSIVAADYQIPTPVAVAPGQIITFFVHGVGAGLTGPVHATTTPLPTLLADISAMVVGINPAQPVPILAVEPISTCGDATQVGCGAYIAITVQMPYQIPAENPGAATGAPPCRIAVGSLGKRCCGGNCRSDFMGRSDSPPTYLRCALQAEGARVPPRGSAC